MSGFVRDIIVKRKFQNDDVTVVLGPAKFGDMLSFGELDLSALKSSDMAPLILKMKGYVKTLDGLKANDASAVNIDEFFEVAYFIDLLTDVLGEWIDKATPADPSSAGASPTG